MIVHRNEPIWVLIVLLAWGLTGCFYAPNPVPHHDFARRLRTPDNALRWTLEQSEAGRVELGLDVLYYMAGSFERSPVTTIEGRIAAMESVAAVIEKRMSGWPNGGDNHSPLSPNNVYWNLARIASESPELLDVYAHIEPPVDRTQQHALWRANGLKLGVIQ